VVLGTAIGMETRDITIKLGFPPSLIAPESLDQSVYELGILDREMIIVEPDAENSIITLLPPSISSEHATKPKEDSDKPSYIDTDDLVQKVLQMESQVPN
jgi:hypothetical protein